MLLSKLKDKYNPDGNERIGFVLEDETIVELENAHSDPLGGASLKSGDLFKYLFSGEFKVIATWHTHPSETSNLSGEDYATFLAYPDIKHYIIGSDGVSEYFVEGGRIKNG